MKYKLLPFFLLASASIQKTYSQTTVIDSFMFDGLMRNFRIYVPSVYTGSVPVPLVFNLHGYTSDAWQQEFFGDFRPVADTANFILVHPNGTLDSSGLRYWNSYGGFGGPDDVGFLSALIDSVSQWYSIDPNAVYSAGMSNGGFMSYQLACLLSSRIAAIASVTGAMTPLQRFACSPDHPMPVMEIHGTSDPIVPYTGTPGSFLPVDSLLAYWVAFNHCNPTATITPVPNTSVIDGCTAERQLFSGGDNGSTVEHYKIIGGAHSWPGSIIPVGATNQDFDASLEIWKFFRKYRLDLLTERNQDFVDENAEFVVFPNPSNGEFVLSFEDASMKKISVMNSLGETVKETETAERELNLLMNEKGAFIIRVSDKSHVSVKKLIVY